VAALVWIGIRSSTLRTFQGAEVIVPNADLIASKVTNWTLSDLRRRADVVVPVAYGPDPRRVMEILEEVARAQESVLEDPAPMVVLEQFHENGFVFEVRCWIDDPSTFLKLRNTLSVAAHEAVRAAGFEIPRAQRDVRFRRGDGAGPDVAEPPA
jgi:small-conductance mechanosensitive channel